MAWIKWLLCFVLLISVPLVCQRQQSVLSCSFYRGSELDRVSFFQPNILSNLNFAPFFYTLELYDENIKGHDVDRINMCREWASYFDNKADVNDIYGILFVASPNEILKELEAKTLKDNFKSNTFISEIYNHGDNEILEYLKYMKSCEAVNSHIDPWDFSYHSSIGRFDGRNAPKTITDGVLLLDQTQSTFIKSRYAFQLVRLYRYSEKFEECIEMFDKYLDSLPDSSVIKNWGLLHKSYCVERIGNEAYSDYLLSKVFENSSKSRRASEGFVKAKTDSALIYAKTDHEKAVLLAMREVRYPGKSLDSIQKIFKLNPGQSIAELLITREINKTEDWLYTYPLTRSLTEGRFYWGYFSDTTKRNQYVFERMNADLNYVSWLRDFVAATSILSSDFRNLALAHLSFIMNDFSSVPGYLSKVKRDDFAVQAEKNLLGIFLLVHDPDLYSSANQKNIKEKLSWFMDNKSKLFIPDKTIRFLLLYLSDVFNKNNLSEVGSAVFNKSTLFDDKMGPMLLWTDKPDGYYNYLGYFSSKNKSSKKLEKLLSLVEKSNKSSFEDYISDHLDKNQLLDLLGTQYIRENNLSEAYRIFSRLPNNYWIVNKFYSLYQSDPFTRMKKIDTTLTLNSYNKCEFVNHLLELAKEAEAEQSPEKYLQVGNACYNMSYFGNAWMMKLYSKGNENNFDVEGGDFSLAEALYYYQKALDLSVNEEQKARICYSMAICEMMPEYVPARWDYKKKEFDKLKSTDHLKAFHHLYSNTDFYQRVHCDVGKDYVN